MKKKLISVVVPVYNEKKNISLLYDKLLNVFAGFKEKYHFEIIFIDDGSTDNSFFVLDKLQKSQHAVKIIQFTRNFGKEIATSAGINHCRGDACILIDADLQHPPELIPKFIQKWEEGVEVVVGVRKKNSYRHLIKDIGSQLFYKIINKISDVPLISGGTDFRLIDRQVIDEFNRLKEKNRMTRALINWLGFRRVDIYFQADDRIRDKSGYSLIKLIRLAFTSFISLSLFPLKLAGYFGISIIILSVFLGLFSIIEEYILHDPLNLNLTGTAMLSIFILFLVGIILICLGLIALYIANIHGEVINRPMYVIRRSKRK